MEWETGRIAAVVVLACSCQPGPPPDTFEGPYLPDANQAQYEPAMVVTPPAAEGQPFFANGLVYAASIQTLSRGFPVLNDDGLTEVLWETQSWRDVWQACGLPGFIGSDPTMTVSRLFEPALATYPAYAVLNFPLSAGGLHVYRTGIQGDLLFGAQCLDLTPAGGQVPPGISDQPRVAWLPPIVTPDLAVPPRLAILWNGGGLWPNNNHQLATMQLGVGGEMLPGTLLIVQLPEPFDPEMNTDYSRCTVPPPDRSERGRGTLIASPDGILYHAYTNYLDDTQPNADPPLPRRVYVEKLIGERWSVCIDESPPDSIVTSGNYFDLGDPAIQFDARSNGIFVAYPLGTSDWFRDIVLAAANASSAASSGAWSFRTVNHRPETGDRGHPAIAVNDLDPLERAFSGAIYVSWYEPVFDSEEQDFPLNAILERYARGYRIVGGQLQPRSASFSISDPFFANVTNQVIDDTGDPRGTHEYQTMAHIPGTADWIGVWGAPKDPVDAANPEVAEFRLRYSTWD